MKCLCKSGGHKRGLVRGGYNKNEGHEGHAIYKIISLIGGVVEGGLTPAPPSVT